MPNLRTIFWTLILFGVIAAHAQEISIPDPGLNAAIRDALQKPNGPLTAQDLLGLTSLQAGHRSITNSTGLDAARNLTLLNLSDNSLTNFTLPGTLTNLAILDLSFNPLAQCSLPTGLTNLTTLIIENTTLTNLNLPAGLNGLSSIQLPFNNQLKSFTLSGAPLNLTLLDLGFNSLTQCFLPDGLANLGTLFLEGNSLTNFTLPAGLVRLSEIDLAGNALGSFALRADMTNLLNVLLFVNQLTNFTVPPNLSRLAGLDLDFNQLRNLNLPPGLTNLSTLEVVGNQLTTLSFPSDMTSLIFIDADGNQLKSFTLPAGSAQVNFLRLSRNKLTSLILPPGMTNLTSLFLAQNQLTNLTLASGLTRLVQIDVSTNQLARLTLPPDVTLLTALFVSANPLTKVVLPDPLAAGALSNTVVTLRNQGVSVSTYPLTVQLIAPRETLDRTFEFAVNAPPGIYDIMATTDFAAWIHLAIVTNQNGVVRFLDPASSLSPHKFYRALLENVPANMVFIPANTFMLGSPSNELGRLADESPQTTVTLTHGFWISKFLVTQRDYLAVTGSNPSGFPGDLNRPVESVPWPDATNYCALLTQQDFAAGRIPPGTHYRLPTEAEWECAARAGTSTRYYYGDDPGATDLTNHAWYGANSGFVPRPVGLKAPNAWGLYDMEGNVWEWCQDWYGPYPGGAVSDPQGPASNAIGFKVIRGGAWESSEFECRSARRSIEGNSPFISDFIIGFRIVLVTDL